MKKEKIIKIVRLTAASIEEAQDLLSALPTENYRDGARAEVTLPDGSRQIYIFKDQWEAEENENYVIKPDE